MQREFVAVPGPPHQELRRGYDLSSVWGRTSFPATPGKSKRAVVKLLMIHILELHLL